MAYYYLISSLPMLKSDGAMPISYTAFLEMCKSTLSEDKYEILKELTLSSNEGAFLSKWSEFYIAIKEELTYQRNLRLGRKAVMPSMREEATIKVVSAAMNHKNPLTAEEMLLALEFEKLDELVGTHYFDDWALMGYALKLKLLERKGSFDFESGKAELNRLVKNLEQEIESIK